MANKEIVEKRKTRMFEDGLSQEAWDHVTKARDKAIEQGDGGLPSDAVKSTLTQCLNQFLETKAAGVGTSSTEHVPDP